MTEADWSESASVYRLLNALEKRFPERASARKVRLFCCACAFRHLSQVPDAAAQVVRVAEAHADGRANEEMLQAAWRVVRPRGPAFTTPNPVTAAGYLRHAFENACVLAASGADRRDYAFLVSHALADAAAHAHRGTIHVFDAAWKEYQQAEVREQARLLRDIFGNPFRPVTFDPAWSTPDVNLLATGIYAERAFDRLPILADALQDAGCDAEPLLAHLRDETAPHVRGCWALDLVLGKS